MQKPSDKKRVCAAKGCETVLCSYNPSRKCSVHGGWTVMLREHEHREALQDLMVTL